MVIGTQGLPPSAPRLDPAAASGTVAPKLLDETAPSSLPVTVDSGAATAMSFERSNVQTLTKGEVAAKAKAQAANSSKVHDVASKALERPAKGKLYAPLENLVPSSPFGLRVDPFSGRPGEFHWGQDFAASCGTRVYAADAGVVRAVGWHLWGGGNRVEIDHGNGLITTYNHLQGIGVQKGEPVRVGQVIAEVGTTGSSTGCHLHFETVVNGVHADPAKFTLLPTRQVDPLDEIQMVSYAPGANGKAAGKPDWAVPQAAEPQDHGHSHDGDNNGRQDTPGQGGKETSQATAPGKPSPSPQGGAGKPGSPAKPSKPGTPTSPGTQQPTSPSTPPTGQPGSPAPTNPAPSKPTPTEPKPTSPTPTEPKPTSPTPTAPKPTSPTPTAPKPTSPTPTAPKPTSPTPTAPKPSSPTPTAPKPTSPTPTAPKPTSPTSPAPTSPAPTSPPPPSPTPTLIDTATGLVGGVIGGLVGGLFG